MNQNQYGHFAFEELLKDTENTFCFDCGKQPAQWASINNSVYLCIDCSGNHRGYGVNISYIRSITLDNLNDNQISTMRCGGNKSLRELLEVYSINHLKVDKTILYNSRLMDFYRKYLRAKASNQPYEQQAPKKEEALKPVVPLVVSTISNQDKYKSISSNQLMPEDDDKGFVNLFNNWMTKAYDSTKYLAEKVGELDISNKIGETGSTILNKGTEISKSETVTSWAKKANEALNFAINSIFGSRPKEDSLTNNSSGGNNKQSPQEMEYKDSDLKK